MQNLRPGFCYICHLRINFSKQDRQLHGKIYTVVLYWHLYRPVVDSVFIVAYLIVGGVLCLVLVLLFTTLFLSSFVIIVKGKRELVALL